MNIEQFREKVGGKLIVSCQALPEEPLHSSFIMGRMALAAAWAVPPVSAPIRWRIFWRSARM